MESSRKSLPRRNGVRDRSFFNEKAHADFHGVRPVDKPSAFLLKCSIFKKASPLRGEAHIVSIHRKAARHER